MKSIISSSTDYYLKTSALNKGSRHELAVFYNYDIIIYDLITEKPFLSLPMNDVIYLEFNTGNKLLAVTEKGELGFFDLTSTNDSNNEIKIVKTSNRVVMAQWYPFTTSDIAYITNKNEVYYQSILPPNQLSSVNLEIVIPNQNKNYQVTEMAWYDADDNYKYLIIGTDTSYVVLVDLNEKNPMIISAFDHYGNGIKRLLWLTYEPGAFISITKNCGRITTWNVSKTSYNHIIKLTDFAIKCVIKYDNETILFSTSKGEVIIYNMKQRKRKFYIDSGHCESIFDVKFNPFTYGLFASCSHDGSIKIWNMIRNALQLTLYLDLNPNQIDQAKDDRVNVLCIKWSPNESHLLASGDSKSFLKIWDINKEKQIASLRFDSKIKKDFEVYGLDWSKDDLVICGCQMSVFINQYSKGKFSTIKIISVDQSVYLIKFNPHEEKEIGVACKDGVIRAYKISNDKNEVVKKYIGHKHKVFGLCYNTSIKLMASSSDDFKIGIWDLNKEERNAGNFLLGHTDNVRSLLWLEHYPHIIISGSWDSTIRFWNVKQMICIALINEHLSDVYGLDICPHHPFLIISASRDNTIRFWNYSKHPMSILSDFANGDSIKVNDISFNKKCNSNSNSNTEVGLAELISKCYYYEDGIEKFWQMVNHISTSFSNSVIGLVNEYTEYVNTIKEIENSYFNNNKIDYSKRKEDIIKELIDKSAKSGQWKQYCEYCIKSNDWESALMSAPHVSKKYWRELTNKYADHCIENNFNKETRLLAILLSDDVDMMIKELFERGDYEDAKLIWVTREKKTPMQVENSQSSELYIKPEVKQELSALLKDKNWRNDTLYPMLYALIEKKLIEGKPLQASSHFLSVNDITNAIKVLLQTNQLEIAYLLMKVFKCYLYEGDIIHGLYYKKQDNASMNDLTNLITQSSCLTTKVTLMTRMILSKTVTISQEIVKRIEDEVRNSNDSLLQAIMSNNVSEILRIVIIKSNELISSISLQAIDCVIKAFDDMIRVFNCLKGIEVDVNVGNPLAFTLKVQLILCAINMDIMNNNTKGASCLMTQYIRLLSASKVKYELKTNDYISLRFAYDYFKDGSNITDKAYCLPQESVSCIESILSKSQSNEKQSFNLGYYKNLQKALRQSNNEATRIYSCEGSQSNKFYYIKNEDFPKNRNVSDVSSFSHKINKHNGIQLSNGNIASLSEYLELQKYSCQ